MTALRAILATVLSIAVCLGIASLAAPAVAQPICSERDIIVNGLQDKYSEQVVGRGLAVVGMMVEVFVSPEGSFTIVGTRPDGMSCLMAAGEAWQVYTPDPITPSANPANFTLIRTADEIHVVIEGTVPPAAVCLGSLAAIITMAETQYGETHEPSMTQHWSEHGFRSHYLTNNEKHPNTFTLVTENIETGIACVRAYGHIVPDKVRSRGFNGGGL